jgi:hypothetical protein
MTRTYHFHAMLAMAATLSTMACIQRAHSQESINMPAATQPSQGKFVLRNQFRYLEARTHPETGDHGFREVTIWNNLAYGITGELSLNLSVPVKYHRYVHGDHPGTHKHWGIGDLILQAKWRIYQHDFGPIDTSRFSLIAGLEIPTFDSNMSSESLNPIIGGVYTHVQGRHGFNIAGRYKFNTGTGTAFNLGGGSGKADALFYDASYLYRLAPGQYGPDTKGAWYALVELNGIYETNGDNEIALTPGIMYEARTWTVEAGIRIPVWQDLDRRPETRFEAIVGLRLLF